MNYQWGKRSLEVRATLHPDLIRLVDAMLEDMDITLIVGHRGKEDQDKACAAGLSHTPWPTSLHNCSPSRAIDCSPFPVKWNDIDGFKKMGALAKQKAQELGIKIRYGGDFTTLSDFDHIELE